METEYRLVRVKRGQIVGYVTPAFEKLKLDQYKKKLLRGVR